MNRWVPRLIIATALLHFAWAFAQPNAWHEIVHDGFAATITDPDAPTYWKRDATVWFLTSGVLLLLVGTLTRQAVRLTDRIPAQTGWTLMATGIPLTTLYFPATGSWALIILGILSLAATYCANPDRTKNCSEAASKRPQPPIPIHISAERRS